ncbi:DMT family transporter [Kiloniella laminariae]|uniref:DMT family transporter n=1 Tax=Kiloniella laminariae TaxID=454162 RepID=A0ABT4LF05_9PROT|nr:DMT family transporter [Kiloniella laminariae]MCZ4279686.1 DMT family transporter [Kiloniella laminariae]
MSQDYRINTSETGMTVPLSAGNLRGAGLMVFGQIAFIGNVTLMKLVSEDLTLFQALFLRGLFTVVVLGALAWYRRELFPKVTRSDGLVLSLRVAGEVGAALCYFMALFNMPIANVTAILLAVPLVLTLGAALLFGETVGWRRYGAIALGFCGVLIIVRPGGEGFDVYSLWALGSMLSVAARDLATRRLSSGLPSVFVAFVTGIVVTLVCALLLPTMEWKAVTTGTVGLLAGSAAFIMLVHISIIMAMRCGEVAFVTPFRYSLLVWAIALGYLVFDEIPDRWTLTGSAIVVATGIYSLWRQQRKMPV